MKKDGKIYIAGHRGLVGSAILRKLRKLDHPNLFFRTHQDLDLTIQDQVNSFFVAEKPEYVFLAAAKVGGILANNTYPAEFIYDNLTIQNNVLHAAWKTGVRRLLFLGSSCIYPRECPQPMQESYFLTGPLEPTNQPYAVAKIAGIVQCEAYNRQYATRFLSVMPTNTYGPNDNYDLSNSHVLPALIRKFHLAKLAERGDWDGIQTDEARHGVIPHSIMESLAAISISSGRDLPSFVQTVHRTTVSPAVTPWGSGRPRREFVHVDDMADACVFLMNLDDPSFSRLCSGEGSLGLPIINIGCGHDQTIRELAELVAAVVAYHGDVKWDASKPDGMPQKLLDVSRLTHLGWKPAISLEEGIQMTYESYLHGSTIS